MNHTILYDSNSLTEMTKCKLRSKFNGICEIVTEGISVTKLDLDKIIGECGFSYILESSCYRAVIDYVSVPVKIYKESALSFDEDLYICFKQNANNDNIEHGECFDIVMYGAAKHLKLLSVMSEEFEKISAVNKKSTEDENVSSNFYVVSINGKNGLQLTEQVMLDEPVALHKNYGIDGVNSLLNVIDTLKKDEPGIVLLHGDAGTGKKTFCREVIKRIAQDKMVIIVPQYLIPELSNPEFVGFLRNQENSVIILENCEKILQKKDDLCSEIVDNILGITMGMSKKDLNIQFLVTVNCDKKNIDKNLLVPGAVTAEHKFGKLKAEDATSLSKEIGIGFEWKRAATLSEIYFNSDTDQEPKKARKKRVGFKDEHEHEHDSESL